MGWIVIAAYVLNVWFNRAGADSGWIESRNRFVQFRGWNLDVSADHASQDSGLYGFKL